MKLVTRTALRVKPNISQTDSIERNELRKMKLREIRQDIEKFDSEKHLEEGIPSSIKIE